MNKIGLVGLTVFSCIVGCLTADSNTRVAATANSADARAMAKIPAWAKVSGEQLTAAKKLGVPVAFANSAGVRFVLIPAGEFMMGSPDDEVGRYKEEGPQHKVRIPKAFYMAIHQTTQGQWKTVMGTTPWKGKDKVHARDGPGYAVNHVCFNDVMDFCAKLGRKDGRSYSLPTEAQWEYACRAGTTTMYFYGDDPGGKKLKQYAWYLDNGWDRPELRHVHKVGVYKPNGWGIYDMLGNVWELCMDAMYPNYDRAPDDGSARTGNDRRVLRGGGLRSTDRRCRVASRYAYHRTHSSYYVGFRIMCAIDSEHAE